MIGFGEPQGGLEPSMGEGSAMWHNEEGGFEGDKGRTLKMESGHAGGRLLRHSGGFRLSGEAHKGSSRRSFKTINTFNETIHIPGR